MLQSFSTRPDGWTELDRTYLEYLVLTGHSDFEIAPKLDRTPRAVREQRKLLQTRTIRRNRRAGRKPGVAA